MPRGGNSGGGAIRARGSCVFGRASVGSTQTSYGSWNEASSSTSSGRIRCYHATRSHFKPKSRGEETSSSPSSSSSWHLGDDVDDEELDRIAIKTNTKAHIDNVDPDDIPDLLDYRFRSLDDDGDLRDGDGDGDGLDDYDDDDDDDDEQRELYRIQQESINDELDQRKGRPWRDPWEITEDQWMASDTGPDSIPDWSPSFVSRIAQERLQILSAQDGNGIPTLEALAAMTIPASDPTLHPARETKTYASYRKSQHAKAVRECVETLAKARVAALLESAKGGNNNNNNDDDDDDAWRSRQDAVDALFEALQEEAKADESMDVLSLHPEFPRWVERGLEDYLRDAQNDTASAAESETESETSGEGDTTASSWKEGTPVFMDCYDPSEAGSDASNPGPMVPSILKPLAPHKHGGPGKMVEEWELAAHSSTKRILIRECTSRIAGHLASAADNNNNNNNNNQKIYVHGKRGTGKSAVLASIVASARRSGCIVMYLPDGDRLRKNGFFVTPSTHPDRKGMFDLQDLSQEALRQLADSHASDLEGMVADRETLSKFFKESQLVTLDEQLGSGGEGGGASLTDLLDYAQEHKKHAPMCYSVVVHHLLHTNTKTDKKFVLVMDEFNCLFDHHGHYFHMAYDEDVREAIPSEKINLFEPILAALNLTTQSAGHEEDADPTVLADRAAAAAAVSASVVVGTTESHAVRRGTTDALTECAHRRQVSSSSSTGSNSNSNSNSSNSNSNNFHVVEVPRFSSLEADHVLANFEAIGIGKLRLDRGDTLMNPQEVEFLKMASGSVGQKLLDVSIL